MAKLKSLLNGATLVTFLVEAKKNEKCCCFTGMKSNFIF